LRSFISQGFLNKKNLAVFREYKINDKFKIRQKKINKYEIVCFIITIPTIKIIAKPGCNFLGSFFFFGNLTLFDYLLLSLHSQKNGAVYYY